MNATRDLLDFIIRQELELDQYPTFETLLPKKFKITKEGKDATKGLVDFIIDWENHPSMLDSLERLLNENFFIENVFVDTGRTQSSNGYRGDSSRHHDTNET